MSEGNEMTLLPSSALRDSVPVHARSAEEVVKALGTCLHSGLSNGQAARLRAEWGENALAEEEPKARMRALDQN